jgi:protein phosphatase
VKIDIPELCLVVLIGAAGAGKSTFAAARFKSTEVVSSDLCRALVADDEDDQSATPAAFEVLHLIASLRLRRRKLTVVDAVDARPQDRRPLLELAGERDCAAVAVVLDLPEELCVQRDLARSGRTVGARAIAEQHAAVERSLPGLREEGFAAVHVLRSPEDLDAARVRRVPLPVNRRWDRGPFDVIGDVDGRLDALAALLDRLGYPIRTGPEGEPHVAPHPAGRRAVFVGDLGSAAVVRVVHALVAAGAALSVRGDRDDDLTARLPAPEADFLRGLPSHLVLAGGTLVVAHAGIRAEMQGRDSPRVTAFCLRGEPGWAAGYRGRALVVHGHEVVPCPRWLGRTAAIDVAGTLTALRHPEREFVSVPA